MPHRFDEDRRNKYAGRHRPGWPSSPRPPNAAPPPTTPSARCSSATPLPSAPTSTPSTTTATSTGSRPWPWSASTRRPGSPAGATSASSGWTRTGSGSSTTTGSPWCPRPRRKSGRPTSPRTPGRPPAPRQGREQLPKCQTGADQPRESPGRTDTRGNQWTVSLNSPCPRQIEEKRGESDATPLRSSRTSGNNQWWQ